MTIRVCTICFVAMALLLAAMPTSALAVDNILYKTGTLVCGDAALTVQTTYLDVPGQIEYEVLEQRLIWRNIKTNQQKELKTDSKYVIKHAPEKRKVLDAAFDVWGCAKSKQGKYYFRINYYCTSGEKNGFCAQGRVEWVRILNEDGSRVIKDSRHWHIKPSYIIKYINHLVCTKQSKIWIWRMFINDFNHWKFIIYSANSSATKCMW